MRNGSHFRFPWIRRSDWLKPYLKYTEDKEKKNSSLIDKISAQGHAPNQWPRLRNSHQASFRGKTPWYRLIVKEYFRIRYVSRSGGLPGTLFCICGYFLVQFSGCIYGWLKLKGVGFLKKGYFNNQRMIYWFLDYLFKYYARGTWDLALLEWRWP